MLAVSYPWWMREAACSGMDTGIFYPGRGDTEHLRLARKTCASCAVRRECLEAALVSGEHFGVWGGTTEQERRRIRRRRRLLAAETLVP